MAIRCRECGCEVTDEIYQVGHHEEGCGQARFPWDNGETGSVPRVDQKSAAGEVQSLLLLLAGFVVADTANASRVAKSKQFEFSREQEAVKEEIGDALSTSICSVLLAREEVAKDLGPTAPLVFALLDRAVTLHPPPGWAEQAEGMARDIIDRLKKGQA